MSSTLVASATLVYVLVEDRADFDRINRPFTDNGVQPCGHCLSKTITEAGVMVIFQHWLPL